MLQARLLPCLEQLGITWEAIFVDDGSQDGTFEQLSRLHRKEPRVRVVALSRNFGHQKAVVAGLRHASGEVIGIMDADLQDPPEMLGTCLSRLGDGYDVVYMVRRNRKENVFKRAAYGVFYRVLNRVADAEIPADSGDFCVMTRRVADVLLRMPEGNIFVRGMRAWAGFRQVGLEYERDCRAAGQTKYPLGKLMGLAADGLFSFSTLPLRAAVYLGLVTLLVSGFLGVLMLLWWVCGFRLMGHTAAELPAWTVLAAGMVLFGGVQLLILGCLGEYIGRIYTEIKQRPRWIVRESLGFGAPKGYESNYQDGR